MKLYGKLIKHIMLISCVTSTYLSSTKAMEFNNPITPSVDSIVKLYKMFPGKEEVINQNYKKLVDLYERYNYNKIEKNRVKNSSKYFLILCLPTIILLIKYLYSKADFYKEEIKNWYIKRKKLKDFSNLRDSERALEEKLGNDIIKFIIEPLFEHPRDVIKHYQTLSYLNKLGLGFNSAQLKNKFISFHQGPPLNSRLLELERMIACIGSACAAGFPLIFGLCLLGEKNNYKNFNELYNQTLNACLK